MTDQTPFEIPAFLRRNKETTMTAAPTLALAPIKAPKKKRKDAYICRITVSIPLNLDDSTAYATAVGAVDGILAELPTGSKIEFASRGLGKI